MVADGGLEGLSLYQEHQHDIGLVILDLSMPGMDGYETLTQLRKTDPDVPVLISSGNLALSARHPRMRARTVRSTL